MCSVLRVLACCLLVAGCANGVPESGPSQKTGNGGFLSGLLGNDSNAAAGSSTAAKPGTRPRMPTPLSKVALAGGDVIVGGPDNYCIDPTTVQKRTERGFAVIASCRILSGGRAGDPVDPALITVTVGPRGDMSDLPSPNTLADVHGAPLVMGQSANDFVAANLAQGGQQFLAGGDDRHWRAAFVQGERLIGLALYAPKGSPLAGDAGVSLLLRVKSRIETLSPGGANATASQSVSGPTQGGGLLGRLFNR
ncbi:dihydroxy-acid dehydratase [Thalassococcus lentus]|uniref:Dihydroxy-acid dehydratase n=1 Tax=Thalassococcus lentus TaxID=1210524 RepID=A0ABT4XNU2_9RHOB|nr:dihydroxy-acid dehydratase [Thalassococcus lentus]MDA7423590.1 dihydroxy-acid dehydratase [Thalassococcus lentus]